VSFIVFILPHPRAVRRHLPAVLTHNLAMLNSGAAYYLTSYERPELLLGADGPR